jgi:hypothetical protein
MEDQIWKYQLKMEAMQFIQMPMNATILACQLLGDDITIWAQVNPNADSEQRKFEIVVTGHPMPSLKRKHIATIKKSGFVWHVFEILKQHME